MRDVLRLPNRYEPDAWLDAERAPDAPHAPWLAPLAAFENDVASALARPGPLGIRLKPADTVEALAPHVSRLSLIAVAFPGPGEGRGYTQAHLLRERFAYRGELRAIGAVKRDQLAFMVRCGFDAFELAPGEPPDAALAALRRYSVAYQPATASTALEPKLRFRRRGA
jgi:uncharacterized protein (DUF934 family)